MMTQFVCSDTLSPVRVSPFAPRVKSLLSMVFALFLATLSAIAQVPDLTNGDVPPDTVYINLGPTGMKGWLYHVDADTSKSRQILVMAVDSGSPAHGVLAVNDVILGADGTGANPVNFTSDARRSFALAIQDAEARSPAVLRLLRWRAGVTTIESITLQTLGAYTATAPYNCPKSALILENGLAHRTANEDSGKFGFGALALLAGNDPSNPANAARQALARTEAHALIATQQQINFWKSGQIDTASKVTWDLGHKLTVLAEYYLQTSDPLVLPTIEALAVQIANGQSHLGTMGHQLTNLNAQGNPNGAYDVGYGTVNSAGMPTFLGLLLAKECGLTNPEIDPAIERASRFYAAYAGYGAHPYGENEPARHVHESNGKSGLASLCFMLQPHRAAEGKFYSMMATAAASERERGHTGPYFNQLWAPLGAAAGGEAAVAAHFSRISWMLDLNREWDGGFYWNRLDSSGSIRRWNNFDMSTVALLTYALPLRELHITGRGHDPARYLTTQEVADAIAADDYNAATRTTSELVTDLGNWSPKVQMLAAEAIGLRTAEHATLIPQLIAIANDPQAGESRGGACIALGEIGNGSAAAVLADLLDDAEPEVRFHSAEALRYLPQADRLAQVNTILVAAASTGKPFFPIDEEDPLQFAHQRLCMLLFNSQSSAGPLGVIWGSGINGINRDLLYPAIRAVAANPGGEARSTLSKTYTSLTYKDVLILSGTILDTITDRAPSDKMFSVNVRQAGATVMQMHNIAEGVPACMKYIEDDPSNWNIPLLGTFGGGVYSVVPDPDVIGFLESLQGEFPSGVLAALDAIYADTNPTPLNSLKTVQLVTADDPTLNLPADSTVLRATGFDHAQGDSIYTWNKVFGPGAVTFTPNGTAEASDTTVQFDGTPGAYEFEVTMSDSRGLTESYGTVVVVLTDGSAPDTSAPPTPGFATAPTGTSSSSITMTAEVVTDPEGNGVKYYFTCTSGGGNDSGWQTSPTYTDTGLLPGTTYEYTVTVRDLSTNQNASTPSAPASGSTLALPTSTLSEGVFHILGSDDSPTSNRNHSVSVNGAYAGFQGQGNVDGVTVAVNKTFNGPIEDYAFIRESATPNVIETYADGGVGRITYGTYAGRAGENINSSSALKLWTATDPGDPAYSSPADFTSATSVGAFDHINGSIDISGLTAGTVYFFYAGYRTTPVFSATMRDADMLVADVPLPVFGDGDYANRGEYYVCSINFVNNDGCDTIDWSLTSTLYDDHPHCSLEGIVLVTSTAQTATVPNVVGLTRSAAQSSIRGANFVVGTVMLRSSTTVPAGNVISQSPSGGSTIARGSAVNLVVSDGLPTTPVPNVLGLEQSIAESQIVAEGLVVGNVTVKTSATVPVGHVISQSPVSGLLVVFGRSVDLVVSGDNLPPVFTADPISGADAIEDVAYSSSISGSATDGNGDVLTYAKVSGPAWLSVATNGTLSGTPTNSDLGLNVFTVSVSDGFATAVEATLEIIVQTYGDPSILVGGVIRNGDFNVGTVDGESFAETPYWYNLTGDQSMELTRNNLAFDGTQHAVMSFGKSAAVDTEHVIAEGDIYDLAYVWRDAWQWLDGSDEIVVSLFVTDDNTITGVRTNLIQDFSGLSTLNDSYEAVDHNAFYTAVAADAGKTLFVVIESTTSAGFARLDNFELIVTPLVVPANSAPVFTVDPFSAGNAAEDAVYADTIAGSATDADSDTLTYAKVSGPAWLSVGTDGTLSGTPTNTDVGANAFTVSVTDGFIATPVEATLNITVVNVNDAPVADDQSLGTDEDAALAVTLTASDIDTGDTLTYNVVTGPTNGFLSGTAPNLTYTPNGDYNGSDSFTFTANDGTVDSNTATVSITVNGINDAPVADNQSVSTDEDVALGITLTASDIDTGDTLTYNVVTGPTNGFLSGTAPNLTYTPNGDYNGSDSFTFTANDGTVDSNIATVSITVNSINDAPVANNQSVSTDEDVALGITLTASDVDGDPLTYNVVTGPTNGFLSGTAPNLTYTPNSDYNGSDSFTFTANDGTVDSNTATVNITVNAINDAPVFTVDPFSAGDAAEDAVYADTIAGSATDADSDTLTYAKVSGPAWLTVGTDGTLSGTPTNTDVGVNAFTVSVTDGIIATPVEATLNITVVNVNDAPVADDQSLGTDEDAALAVTLTASDIDTGDTLTYNVVTGPTNGFLSGTAPNLTYTPNGDYNGSDSFTFTANDGTVDSNTATVSITVNAINDAPVFTVDPFSAGDAAEDAVYADTIAGSATDADSDTLTYAKVSGPAWLSVGTDGTLSGTPTNTDVGANAFTVSVTDGIIATPVEATLNITVVNVNDAPVADDQSLGTDEDAALAVTLTASDIDTGDTLTYSVVTGPTNGFLSGTAPNLTYTPNGDYNGSDSFTFTANDGTVDSNTATVSITVNAINDAPVFTVDPFSTGDATEDALYADTIAGSATDADSDTLTYAKVSGPAWLTVGTDGTLSGTPTNADLGTNIFTVSVTDGVIATPIEATLAIIVETSGGPIVLVGGTILNGDFNIGTVDGESFAETPYWYNLTGDQNMELTRSNLAFDGTQNAVMASGKSAAVDTEHVIAEGDVYDLAYVWRDAWQWLDGSDEIIVSLFVTDDNTITGVRTNLIQDFSGLSTLNDSYEAVDHNAFYTAVAADAGKTLFVVIESTTSAGFARLDNFELIVTPLVVPANSAPVFTVDPFSTGDATEDAAYADTIAGSATDADSDTLTYAKVSGPAWLTVGTDGTLSGTPTNADLGTNAFTVSVTDGIIATPVEATLNITVVNVNDAPVADDQSLGTNEDAALAVTLTASDIDTGDTLTYNVVTGPTNGTLSGTAPNLTYTPNGDYNGSDSFTFTANDGTVDSNTATVSITVNAINDAPVFTVDPFSTGDATEDAAYADTIAGSATDADGDAPTYAKVSGPSWLSVATNGTLSGTPASTDLGANAFIISVSDGNGGSDTATLNITVNPAPSASKLFRTTLSAVGNDSWQTVDMGQTYSSAVIVATPVLPGNTHPPVVTRLRNVSGSSFDIKIERIDGQIGTLAVDVHIIAVEEGVFTVAEHGVKMEAVKYTSTITSSKSGWVAEAQTYQNSYSSPVVVGQVMTSNDADWSVFWCQGSSRTSPPSASTLATGKHVGEDPVKTRADETIGYIVIESGSGSMDGVNLIAGLGADTILGPGNSSTGYSYSLSGLSSAAAAAVSLAGMDGADGGFAVLAGANPLTATSITLYVDEDTLGDTERSHTNEQIGYLILE